MMRGNPAYRVQPQKHGWSICWSHAWTLKNGSTDRHLIEMPFGDGDLVGPKEPCIRQGPVTQEEGAIWGVIRPTENHCDFWSGLGKNGCTDPHAIYGLALVSPRNHLLDTVKFEQIHLLPQGITSWRDLEKKAKPSNPDAVWGRTMWAQGAIYSMWSRSDESTHRHVEWQDCDAAFCQNSLNTFY